MGSKKYVLRFVFMLSLIISMMWPANSLARDFEYTYEGQTIIYTVLDEDAKTVTTKEYSSGSHPDIKGSLILPSNPIDENGNSYTLTEIGSFHNCDLLTSVVIPNTVTIIRSGAFWYCTQLTSVELPNSLTTIESSAFYESGLTSIEIPNSVTSIGTNVFCNCSDLTDVKLSNSITTIESALFYNCHDLKSVEIPNSVISIGVEAFGRCWNLKSIVIPNSVKVIKNRVFTGCSGLSSIIIGKSVTEMGKDVFEGCNDLKGAYPETIRDPFPTTGENISRVEYPIDGTTIKDGWIWSPDKSVLYFAPVDLEGEYTVPNYVKEIKNRAFAKCKQLTSVIIPASLESLYDYAFEDCKNLTSVVIGNTFPMYNGYRPFYNCTSLVKCACPENFDPFSYCYADNMTLVWFPLKDTKIENGWVWNKDKSAVYFAPFDLKGECTLPESVSYIGDKTFWRCEDLTSLKLMSNNPPSFSETAFETLFYETALLTIPTGSLFDYCNTDWYKFENIHEEGADGNAIRYRENDFNYVCSTVSKEAMLAKGHYSWMENIEIPNRISVENGGIADFYNVTEIGKAAFKDCSIIETVTLSDNLYKIDQEAFSGCTGITSLSFPDKLTSIGYLAFVGSGLKSISLPKSIKSIEMSAFQDCSSLKSIIFNDEIADLTIGSSAFQNSGISNVEIQNGVTSIKEGVFRDCKHLKSAIIGDGVTEIPEKSFMGCLNLEEVNFGKNVSSIRESAFRSTSLTNVLVPNKVEFLGDNAFADCNSLKSFALDNGLTNIELGKDILINSPVETINIGRTFSSAPFINLNTLTNLNIGNTVLSIPDSAFYGCSKLKTIKLGSSIKSIGSSAFENSVINDIVIPPSVESIGQNAFASNYIVSLAIGYGIREIGEKSFYGSNRINIFMTAENSPNAYNNTFSSHKMPLWLISQSAIDDYSNNPKCWYLFEKNMKIIVPIEKLNSTKRKIYGMPGDSIKLEVSVVPEDATLTNIFWHSTRPDLISVDNDGNVTFLVNPEEIENNVKTGEIACQIIASTMYKNAPIMSFDVYFGEEVNAEGITLNESELNMITGESSNLTASVYPADVTDDTIIWNSNNLQIATVDENGIVTAIAIGEAVITASCGNVSASCKVNVNPILAESLTIAPDVWSGEVGNSFQISAVVLPENTTDKTLTWESSDSNIATVDENGTVTLIAVGEAVITASCGNVSASCKVNVNPILAETLTITPDVWSGEEGSSFQISATLLPENTTDKTLKWESSDSNIATVDDYGLVTILNEGKCIISVYTVDGSNLMAECYITVQTGIDQIFNDSTVKVDVYNLNGIIIKHDCTKEDLLQLKPDLYIIIKDGKLMKIYINKNR